MERITTYKGETLVLVNAPFGASDFGMGSDFEWSYRSLSGTYGRMIVEQSDVNSFIDTTDKFTEQDVKPFVEEITFVEKPYKRGLYHSYTDEYKSLGTALESWNSFLESNNIDIAKNWVVFKIKNPE